MKKIIAIALIAITLIALVACGDSEMKAVSGTYTGEKCKFVGDSEWQNEEFSIELKADGTGTFNRDDEHFSLTWTLEGEKFTMKETFLGISNDYTGTLKDGVLDIFNGDPEDDLTYEYVLKK